MNRFRTTARGILALAVAVPALVVGAASAGSKQPPATIVFPVLGPTTYTDDFGAPRAGGPHQGIDMLAPKRALALAAEAGKIKFWTHSATAGCMLYLYGASGTTYYYIHLNNDLTKANDNRGKCVAGTAYAKGLKNGAKVSAGQVIGYVGDSGDANGLHPHLHFELHPDGGKAVDPYQWLQTGQHLLFAAPRGSPFTLELRGTVAGVTDTSIRVKVATTNAWPMRQRQTKLKRKLLVDVPAAALVQTVAKLGGPGTPATLADADTGQAVDVWTVVAPASLKAERGDDLALSASLVSLVRK
ncbi:MAG TPA: M23 family metallopeptidase [Gaiellaceae bacterium]